MKADDVRIQAQLTSGLQINAVVGLKWVNEAIKDVCTTHAEAGERVSEDVTVTVEPTEYTVKKNLIKLIDIDDLIDNYTLAANSIRYTLNDDNTITFHKKGSYRVKYFSLPDPVVSVTDTVPLHFFFDACLEYYLAYKMRARLFGQGDNNAVSFFQQYQTERDNAELKRRKLKKKRQMPPGRRW